MNHETCKDALDAWNSGQDVTTINISGMGMGYELACQRLMFEGIAQHLEHEGDAAFWDEMVGEDAASFFTAASALSSSEGYTGAMWGASMAAAVVMLRNGWKGGMGLAPPERVVVVVAPSEVLGTRATGPQRADTGGGSVRTCSRTSRSEANPRKL